MNPNYLFSRYRPPFDEYVIIPVLSCYRNFCCPGLAYFKSLHALDPIPDEFPVATCMRNLDEARKVFAENNADLAVGDAILGK